jgi:hypothetical protein
VLKFLNFFIPIESGNLKTKDTLYSRLETNSKFGSFYLHEWVEKKFIINKGAKVLDLVSRDQSHTKIFQNQFKKNGLVFGLDKNLELLKSAKIVYKEKSTQNASTTIVFLFLIAFKKNFDRVNSQIWAVSSDFSNQS